MHKISTILFSNEVVHHRRTLFSASIASHVVVVDILLTYSNLHFNDLLCSSLSWTVLSFHVHPSRHYLRPFIDRFFYRKLLISDRDVACFNFRPWASRFALPRCVVSFPVVAGCFPSGKYLLDLTYYWSPWPVSLGLSVIHHVISAYTSSRLVTNHTCNFNTFNSRSVCNFRLLTH